MEKTYRVTAINLGSFELGEADKVLYVFSAEKGLQKAIAKGARKPKTRMSGRVDPLYINEFLLAPGRSFEIITEVRTVETFAELRHDFERLSYALYYAEVARAFADGLEHESLTFFDFLVTSVHLQSKQAADALWLCMEFEMGLLEILGYRPELTYCIGCRQVLSDYNLARFNIELGGVVCLSCFRSGKRYVRDTPDDGEADFDSGEMGRGVHLTPMVWKNLVLTAQSKVFRSASELMCAGEPLTKVGQPPGKNLQQSWVAAQRLLKTYAEHRAGKKFRALDLLSTFPASPDSQF